MSLSDSEIAKVKALGQKLGITPEQLVKMVLEERLRSEEAIDHVLEKNAELYRRLA